METFSSVLTSESTLNGTTSTLEAANTHTHALQWEQYWGIWYMAQGYFNMYTAWARDRVRVSLRSTEQIFPDTNI